MWARIGVVAAAVWVGLVALMSATSRNFEWFPNSYANQFKSEINFGPAFVWAVAGIAIIAVLAVGIPWIGKAK